MIQKALFENELDKKFRQYHFEHPEVFKFFAQFALQLKHKGFKHFGAKAIMERIRWEVALQTGRDGFKINNNYTSRYARLLEQKLPMFRGFFRKRALQR